MDTFVRLTYKYINLTIEMTLKIKLQVLLICIKILPFWLLNDFVDYSSNEDDAASFADCFKRQLTYWDFQPLFRFERPLQIVDNVGQKIKSIYAQEE